MHTTQSETGGQRNLPDRIADRLIARIFTRDLLPGARLPPERSLAEGLGVDRSSLRMGLRQLSRMNLVRSVRGSGATVVDWEQCAGVDFLAAVFENPELEVGGSFLSEALGAWLEFVPRMLTVGFQNAQPSDVQRAATLLARQLEILDSGGPLQDVVELEVDLQDLLLGDLGSTLLSLLRNSTRPLRQRLVGLLFETGDALAHVRFQTQFVQQVASAQVPVQDMAERYRAYIIEAVQPLQCHLAQMRAEPRLKDSAHGALGD